MQDNRPRELEKSALMLAFPAGATAYFIHGIIAGEWTTTAGWVPSVFSALLIAVILHFAKTEDELSPLNALALSAMHVVGGATMALLASVAMADMPTVAALRPMLLWTQAAALTAFAVTDLGVLTMIMLARERE